MQCLKCGREIVEGQVFCNGCLKVMAANPVKPNTVVTIPERDVRVRRMAPRSQNKSEELVDRLERKIMQLRLWVCMLTAAVMVCVGLLTWQHFAQEDGPVIGQNYTSVTDFAGGGR